MYQKKSEDIRDDLNKTRKLFTLLDPIVKNKYLLVEIVKFQSGKVEKNKELKKEISNVETQCKLAISNLNNLLEQLNKPTNEKKRTWQELLINNNNEFLPMLENAKRVFNQLSNSMNMESKKINRVIETNTEKTIVSKSKNQNSEYWSSRTMNEITKMPAFKELLNTLKHYPKLTKMSLSSALYTLKSSGHGNFVDELTRRFTSKEAILNFLENYKINNK
jgi:hypothetical protein